MSAVADYFPFKGHTMRRIISRLIVAVALAMSLSLGASPVIATASAVPVAVACTKVTYRGAASAPTQLKLTCGGSTFTFKLNSGTDYQERGLPATKGHITIDSILWFKQNTTVTVWYTYDNGSPSRRDDSHWLVIRNLKTQSSTKFYNGFDPSTRN